MKRGSFQLFAMDGPVLRYAVDGGHQTATRPDQTRPAQSNSIQFNSIQSHAYFLFLLAVNLCAHTHKSAEQGRRKVAFGKRRDAGVLVRWVWMEVRVRVVVVGKRKRWLR